MKKKMKGGVWYSTKTINQFDNEPLMFEGENPNAIKDDIEKYLLNLYPHDNS